MNSSTERSVALSIVIPAYNEVDRLGPTVAAILAYVDGRSLSSEVIVVDDGSTDGTVSLVQELARQDPRVRLLALPYNRGKGAAVRAGMLAGVGERLLFSDADLATPIAELVKLEAKLDAGFDVAIGSRGLKDSDIRVRQHPLREGMGRCFNVLVQALLLRGLFDTQCGFKLFTRVSAQDLFSRSRVDGFAFDVEVLLRAKRHFRVVEVPVEWRHVEESKVSPVADAARMFWDVVKLRMRAALDRSE